MSHKKFPHHPGSIVPTEFDYTFKILFLGSIGVGKTSIINQFISKKFNPKMSTSVSAQFTSKIMEFPEQNRTLRFDIWDTVGQEKYRSLTKIFYKDAKIIIFVYDITTEYSFNALQTYWYTETVDNTDGEPIYAVCANKYDLYDKAVVKTEDGKKFADKIKNIRHLRSRTFSHIDQKLLSGCKWYYHGIRFKKSRNF